MSKRLRWASGNTGAHFSLALPALFLSLTATPGSSASEVLRKAFDSQFKHRAEMVQMAATPSDPGSTVFKLFTDPKRGAHLNIMSPTVISGTRSVDNKKVLRIYYPNQKELVEQASPQRFRLPTDKRIKLIERNFTLSLKDEGTLVANRKVYVVYLKAKNSLVGDRILSVDREYGTILRSVLREGPEKFFKLLDTVTIDYEVKDNPKEFQLPGPPSVQKVVKWGPVDLPKFKNANDSIGFAPRIPSTLPFGFEITHKHIVGKKDGPYFFACRLSDGMNYITVYQWNPKNFGGENPFQNVKTSKDMYEIRYYTEGDAPKAVQDEVRRTFTLR